MSKYLVKHDEWTEVSEQTGTIQNIDDGCPIEVSTEQVEGSGVILYPWEMKPFSNIQLYIRGYNKNPLPTEVRVVPFEVGQGGGGGGGSYVLPTATATRLGGVKIGNNVNVQNDGTISVPVATDTRAGVVIVGDGIDVAADGTIDVSALKARVKTIEDNQASGYHFKGNVDFYADLPSTGMKAGDVYNIINGDSSHDIAPGDNVAWVEPEYDQQGQIITPGRWDKLGGSFSIDPATASKLGGVRIGNNITVQTDGTISVPNATTANAGVMTAADKAKLDGIEANANNYTLPTATAARLGGVKIGQGITIAADGTISVNGVGIGTWAENTPYPVGTYVTYNNDLYLCTTAHTSGSTFDPTKWKLIGGGSGAGISEWETDTDYSVGDYVTVYNYGRQEWQENTAYSAGDFVTNGGNLYKCVVSHIAGNIFEDDLSANMWEQVPREGALFVCVQAHRSDDFHDDFILSGDWDAAFGGIEVWDTTKHYERGQYVTVLDTYKYPEWAANINYDTGDTVVLYNRGRDAWETGKAYAVGDYVTMGKALYRCEAEHTSALFVDDVAAGDWTLLDTEIEEFVCTGAHTASSDFDTDLQDGKWSQTQPSFVLCICKQEHFSSDFAADRQNGSWQAAGDEKQLAEAWAIDPNSPDGKTDYDSPTGKTQSSRTWALSSKQSAADAEGYAEQTATQVAPFAYDPTATYNYPDIVAFTDGYTYRCVGQNVTGIDPSTDPASWVCLMRVTENVFEYDTNSDLMPVVNPVANSQWDIDGGGNIMPAA